MKKILAAALYMSAAMPGFAQGGNMKTTEGGLSYRIYEDKPGTKFPKIGDYVDVHIRSFADDSLLYDSRKMDGGKPQTFQLNAPAFKGDLVEGLLVLTPGDKATFEMPIATLRERMGENTMTEQMKKAKLMRYDVQLAAVLTQEEMKAKQQADAEGEDKTLQQYFAEKGLKPKKTASGLYYIIDKEGDGAQVKAGSEATVNYTGTFMSGTAFDSNVDPKFGHVEPFRVPVGQGRVIRGWDEGLQLLKKGSKARFFIPSALAYGKQGQGTIMPNTTLVFSIEVVDVQ